MNDRTGNNYQAILKTPFGILGICCIQDALTGIGFLFSDKNPQRAILPIAQAWAAGA
jgi:hypothetical protein